MMKEIVGGFDLQRSMGGYGCDAGQLCLVEIGSKVVVVVVVVYVWCGILCQLFGIEGLRNNRHRMALANRDRCV